ncbi:MAG: hypothetical protein HC933_03300 [Pleurocapsa sp. SU_196_0]|nr:hypothetical protein [Pleurocapsa sp. SU_196_0]
MVWIIVGLMIVVMVNLLGRLTKNKQLQGAPIAYALAAGGLAGIMLLRLVRSDFTLDLVKYQFGFFGLVLVLMMLFRPDGFIPAARSKAVKQSKAALLGGEVAA